MKNILQQISKEDSEFLKGLFCICVLVHHLYQQTYLFSDSYILGRILQSLGYLSVSVFFFISGYGLMISYRNKGENYINNFISKRLVPFYIQNIILIIIYWIWGLILSQKHDAISCFQSFLFGKTIISNGWYIQAIILIYVIFYLSMRCNKNIYISIFTGIVGYIALCLLLKLSSVWYECIFAFVAGVLYTNCSKIKKEYSALYQIGVVAGIFILSFILGNAGILNTLFRIVFKMISAICFPVLVVLLKNLTPWELKIFSKLSKISFEIYVSQGLFLSLYHSSLIYILNDYLYIFLVTISTIIFSIGLHILFKRVTVVYSWFLRQIES